MYMTQVRLPMSNAESLVAKAHEWIDQVGHELGWDENRTKARKSKCAVKTVFPPLRFPLFVSKRMGLPLAANLLGVLVPTRQFGDGKVCNLFSQSREKCQTI